ncbi:MAG: DoxX family membrane protein [Patescibacteria group bacterium]|mgnify:CR=1 FL=1
MEFIFLLGRVLFGALFLYSGWGHFTNNTGLAIYAQGKGVPMPRIAVLITGFMIVLGGLGLILGIYVKLSILLLSLFLIGTLFKMHTFWKETNPSAKAMEQVQFFKNAALLGALLMFLSLLEPWSLSL